MPVTRSRKNGERAASTRQEDQVPASDTAEPAPASEQVTSDTSPDTGTQTTQTTQTTHTWTHGTTEDPTDASTVHEVAPAAVAPPIERSVRSSGSKKRRMKLALEEKLRLAEIALIKTQLARMEEETDSEGEDDVPGKTERVKSWLRTQSEHRRERTVTSPQPTLREMPAPPVGEAPHLRTQSEQRRERDVTSQPPTLQGTPAPSVDEVPHLPPRLDVPPPSQPLLPRPPALHPEEPTPPVEREPSPLQGPNVAGTTESATPGEPAAHSQIGQGVITIDILAAALAQNQRIKRAPKYLQDLPSYSGAPGEWLQFKRAFQETESYFSRLENVARIRHALQGKAKEAAQSLMLSTPEPSDVIAELEGRFGRVQFLVLAEVDKLKRLPQLRDTAKDLCAFAGQVSSSVATLRALDKPEHLHNPELVRIVLEKLTVSLHYRWYDYAAKNKDNRPVLQKISSFLNEEADKCGDYIQPDRPEPNSASTRPKDRIERRLQKTFVAEEEEAKCSVCEAKHYLLACPKFLAASVDDRWTFAKNARTCFRCLKSSHRRSSCKSRACGVGECKASHHRLLHADRQRRESEGVSTAITAATHAARALLKIVPVTLTGPKRAIETFALLDEGSTVTLIDQAVAHKLGARGVPDPLAVMGISGITVTTETSRRIDLRIRGKHCTEEHELRGARTMTQLKFPPQSVTSRNIESYDHLIDLRSVLSYENAVPTLLIGQDNWQLIVSRELRSGHRDQPAASLTQLGWVLHGCRNSAAEPVAFCSHVTEEERSFNELAREHFRLESLGVEPKKTKNDPEERALRVLEATTQRLPDGRFETGLLWRYNDFVIPDNREMAFKRLVNLEKKLTREPDLQAKYTQQIEHLLSSGYAEPAPKAANPDKTWYLPHFAVTHPAKQKIRVVYDAAAKYKGVSLNDLLLPGPDLLQSLPGVLMKFRQKRVAVTADVKEMFLQIRIRQEDRDALRFLWRGDRDAGAPTEYRMTSVVFGATSSPCTAIYVKNKNAENFSENHPEAAKAVVDNHYMDDYLQSFDTAAEARRIASQVADIHKAAGFELRGWASNHKGTVADTTSSPQQVEIGGHTTYEKTLGMRWNVEADRLSYALSFHRTPKEVLHARRMPTKREALSIIMSLFDPLGLVTPVITPAKRILQDTWRMGTGWDEELAVEMEGPWHGWLDNLKKLSNLQIRRCYDVCQTEHRELHTFVDASETAYAAAVYWRSTRQDGSIEVALVCAKSRVAPLKPTSIPRLELQAALLGSRLAATVETEHEWKATSRTFWSDSTTVLAWIRSDPRTFKTFVAHRLAEIEDLTKVNEWRWVPTKENVADDGTRDTPPDFDSRHRWFNGPAFLRQHEDRWPREAARPVAQESGEEKTCAAVDHRGSIDAATPDVRRFSSWLRLIRTTARVLQFVELVRKKKETTAAGRHKRTRSNRSPPRPQLTKKKIKVSHKPSQYKPLEARLLKAAEELLVKVSQRQAFGTEIRRLKSGQPPATQDRLAQLALIIDQRGVLRLKSRIAATKEIEDDQLRPAVLDGGHPFVRLYIDHVHRQLHHGGVETVVNEILQRYWIVRLRPSVRSTLKSCLLCRIKKALPVSPATGDHPAARLAHHARPFTFVGLDYFGPVEITVGRHHEKRYVALFTCLTVRAVHLEVAASLSADSAIAALRRFIARRGCPVAIHCDNATNFKGAENELKRAYEAVEEAATNKMIEWRYIPPGAPFMGGAWERLVRSVKTALDVTLKERYPHEETLTTLLAEAENTVNSRPLTHVAVSSEDHEALTPNHILLGAASNVPSPGNFSVDDMNAKVLWRRAQWLADNFWRRWVREYLPQLQHRREPRGSGRPPVVGDVVIVADPHLPRNTWPRGRIEAVHPGPDNIVRVVDVRLAGGKIMRRPAKRIVVLPGEDRGEQRRRENVTDDDE